MRLVSEFREFIDRGNMIDLAIGVVIGGAFGKIISSLVSDVILPPIGWFLHGVDLKDFQWVLGGDPVVAIRYGNFLQVVLEFLIIAFSIFLTLKIHRRILAQKDVTSPLMREEIQLLSEIRDLLRKDRG